MPSQSEKAKPSKKIWTGTVVSDKPDQTVVVLVNRVSIHPVYQKRLKRTKKYQVHDPGNKHKVGDVVRFTETRPLSRMKRWIVV